MSYRVISLGCGHRKALDMGPTNRPAEYEHITLDIDRSVDPTVVHSLDIVPYPFRDNSADEIHAYDVIEHCGRQGDWMYFFTQFEEIWRILKPGAYFFASVPSMDSPWLWGDPGHRRAVHPYQLSFLDRSFYAQCGQTKCTDYRPFYRGDLALVDSADDGDSFRFVLQARKP